MSEARDTALRAVASFVRGKAPPALSFFEFWPGWLFYTPVVAHWLLMGVRYGGMTLPTAANPRIESGGLCGESKSGILDQVRGSARGLIARYVCVAPDRSAALRAMQQANLHYPVVVKPDIGCNGAGVRLIRDDAALDAYLGEFPADARLMIQEYVPHQGEAGIFYVRDRGAQNGRITSVTLKHVPMVTGDGRTTLHDLIKADSRAGRVSHLYLPRLRDRLHTVPAAGERVPLVFAGNHCKGSIFENGAYAISAPLTAAIERFVQGLPDYHFGRIDVRYESLAQLRLGLGFRIIEVNGTGSEATHIWDPSTRLVDAWRAQFQHYGAAFRIGYSNRKQGARPTKVMELLRLWRRQRDLMARYPIND